MLADILRDTVGPEPARPHFKRAMQEPKLRENAFLAYCWTWVEAKQRKEAAECVDTLLKEYPDNGEAWRLRLVVLGADAPESVDAMKRFLATQDPERWPVHKDVAKTVRTLLAELEGNASAPDAFKARVARATTLERSQEGHDYLAQFMPKTSTALGKVMGACVTGKTGPGQSFTAVMDVLANGTIANVEVAPVHAQSSCYAKRIVELVTAPRPPQKFAEKGFPVVIHTSWK